MNGPLSDAEVRVLRYLPAAEIAGELYVSRSTVRTRLRRLFAELGTHKRAGTVARACALGLLAPSPPPGARPRLRLTPGAGRVWLAGSRASRRVR